VPHHNSVNHPFYQKLRASSEFVVVDILDDTLLPLRQILQSDVVVSQSLHGLIYAESLGKPNSWISERQDPIWRFKFEDWYSTTAMPQRNPYNLTTNVEDLIANADLHDCTINKQDLARSLPLATRAAASSPLTDFRTCRRYNPVVVFVDTLLSGQFYNEDEVDQHLLERLTKKVFPVFYGLFSHWAERSYCMIVPADEEFDMAPEKLAGAVRLLDENPGPDFAFIVPGNRIPGPAITGDNAGSAIVRKADQKRAGGGILLRPDSYRLSQNFVTLIM
jgi:hypothetical protein